MLQLFSVTNWLIVTDIVDYELLDAEKFLKIVVEVITDMEANVFLKHKFYQIKVLHLKCTQTQSTKYNYKYTVLKYTLHQL